MLEKTMPVDPVPRTTASSRTPGFGCRCTPVRWGSCGSIPPAIGSAVSLELVAAAPAPPEPPLPQAASSPATRQTTSARLMDPPPDPGRLPVVILPRPYAPWHGRGGPDKTRQARRLLQQTRLPGAVHGLRPVAHAELAVDRGHVALDGVTADDELVGDLRHGEMAGEQA